jgi:hypothetical protein
MILSTALVVLLQATTAEPRPYVATPPADTGAYLDPGAHDLVRGARARRERVERSIDAYAATVRQRVFVGLDARSRERTIYSRENAARVEWRRPGGGRIQVLGARERTPMVRRRASLPDDVASDAANLAFDPDQMQISPFTVGFAVGATRTADGDTTTVSMGIGAGAGDTTVDPLGEASESHYRFRSGDTTAIRLPDGTVVRVIELRVIPRRRDHRLVRGSIWLEAETHGIVRTVFQPARPHDLRSDSPETDWPLFMRAAGPVRAEVRYVTVEYGLWHGRWWLPRMIAVEAVGRMGAVASVPIRMERSYEDYDVTASSSPSLARGTAAADSVAEGDPAQCERGPREDGLICRCRGDVCYLWRVDMPDDTAALVDDQRLPPPVASAPHRLITGEEVASLAEFLGGGFEEPDGLRPRTEVRIADLGHLRYNRVEALAVGAGARVELGKLAVDGTAWIGTADGETKAEIGLMRESLTSRLRLAAYRRLDTFEGGGASSLGRTFSALLLGRDEVDYLLATGGELTGRPVRQGPWFAEWRLFAEHQHPLVRNTDVALARVWEGSPFRDVRAADRADQAGAALALGVTRASPSGFRWRADAGVRGEVGTFDHARGSLGAQMGVPVGPVMALLEAGAGTTAGDLPVQGQWYLGGPTSVRGYPGTFVGGEAFWRARAELATPTPAARLAIFGDAAWVGARDAWQTDPTLVSAGVGASFLDGLIRADLARAMRGRTGWRLELYLNGGL